MAGAADYAAVEKMPRIYSGVYGLGSRDTRVGDLIAVAQNMIEGGAPFFSLNIVHPTALERHDPDVRPAGAFSMRAFGRRLRLGHDQQGDRLAR
jgi:pyruvate-ferredoxin/flavodoxin oxidoreductase